MILFIVFTLFMVITIGFTIILYIKQTESSERLKFGSLSTLLQTLFVFITLWITIFLIRSSSSDTQNLFNNLDAFNNLFSQMNSSLNEVSIKLKEMPVQIGHFAKSIDSLNISIDKQKSDYQASTRELNNTINELSTSVKDYEKNINDYSNQLKTIVELTDKQLVIWKEQQRVILDEYSRKPILKLSPKEQKVYHDTCEIIDLVISNDGDVESNIRTVFLFVPSNSSVTLTSPSFNYWKTDISISQMIYTFYPQETNIEVVSAKSSIIIPCSIKLAKIYRNQIGYKITYNSKYISGNQVDFLYVK
jgi:hypothetical protein